MNKRNAIRFVSTACIALLYVCVWQRALWTPSASSSPFSSADLRVLRHNSFRSPAHGGSTVIVTAATGNYLRLVHNLACSVRRSVARNTVVFSLDRNLSSSLAHTRIPHISFSRFNHASASNGYAFGSHRFNFVSKLKLSIVLHVLSAGFDVLFTDVDVVWCADVFAQLSSGSFARSTLLIQNDSPTHKLNSTFNSGFYYARAERATIRFFHALVHKAFQTQYQRINDQVTFNRVACKEQGVRFQRRTRAYGKLPCCRWARSLDIVSLPLQLFPNGASKLQRQRMYQLPRGKLRWLCDSRRIAVWHNNWCGSELKVTRFEQHRMWMASAESGSCVDSSHSEWKSVQT